MEQLLELAWRTAYDSATYDVKGDGTETDEFLDEAKEHIRNIDKNEWYPEARKILQIRRNIDDHALAEEASTNFINKKMGSENLKVALGGDW